MIRVSVLNPDGTPAMPTKSSRARRWLRDGKAVVVHNDLTLFSVRLVAEPSGRTVQDVVIGIDPGKLFSGIGVQSSQATLFKAHLALPFKSVTKKMTSRRTLRRTRRGRRINRTIAFSQRAHRQKRFSNRRQGKLPPSIRANRQLELRVVQELLKLFPVSHLRYEVIKARTENGKGKGFSPAMVGQKIMLQWLESYRPTTSQQGWQTSILRQQLGLSKDKTDKSKQTPDTHANDGIALAASHFMSFEAFHTATERGHHWLGQVQVTDAPFRVITRPHLYRRQLHFENPDKGGMRKRKGGTVTPFGFRSGDWVKAEKAGQTVLGWIGGFTDTAKTRNVSVYDHNWKRLGQYSLSKVQLLQRSTGLCVTR
ncbi:MAG: RRXRR domain-containing protein [Phormidesmis sp. CAN_BIN36]|nr:RRXRR domain-containing protein [Phormidesmis sp. CAN_BIN36]